MYSQSNEEQIILDYFGDYKGRFLDVGAYDGVTFSNVRQLALNEWEGVMVEPCEKAYIKMVTKYYGMPVKTVKAAIGEHNTEIIIMEGVDGESHPGALSVVADADNPEWSKHCEVWEKVDFLPRKAKQITYASLFDEHGSDYDFISIDAEGMSLRLLYLLPFDSLTKIKCICVEHDNKFTEIIQHGLIHGFDYYACTSENVIMMKGKNV